MEYYKPTQELKFVGAADRVKANDVAGALPSAQWLQGYAGRLMVVSTGTRSHLLDFGFAGGPRPISQVDIPTVGAASSFFDGLVGHITTDVDPGLTINPHPPLKIDADDYMDVVAHGRPKEPLQVRQTAFDAMMDLVSSGPGKTKIVDNVTIADRSMSDVAEDAKQQCLKKAAEQKDDAKLRDAYLLMGDQADGMIDAQFYQKYPNLTEAERAKMKAEWKSDTLRTKERMDNVAVAEAKRKTLINDGRPPSETKPAGSELLDRVKDWTSWETKLGTVGATPDINTYPKPNDPPKTGPEPAQPKQQSPITPGLFWKLTF